MKEQEMIKVKQIMKRAHELAKMMEGDYSARLALGLRQAWKEARQPKGLADEVTFKFDTGWGIETIRLSLNRWTKYGKDRIYVNQGRVKIGFFDLQSGNWNSDKWNSNPTLNAAAANAIRNAAIEAGLIA